MRRTHAINNDPNLAVLLPVWMLFLSKATAPDLTPKLKGFPLRQSTNPTNIQKNTTVNSCVQNSEHIKECSCICFLRNLWFKNVILLPIK